MAEILVIEGLGYRGEGYCRTPDNRFVSVHHALPGDRLLATVGEFRRGRAWAEPIDWLERSAEHVDPDCDRYDACSGCALRHVSLAFEQSWKLSNVREILSRYGPPEAEELPIEWIGGRPSRLGHRSRGRFRVEVSGSTVSLGLRGTSLAGDVVDIRGCRAQSATFTTLMGAVGDVLDQNPVAASAVEWVDIRTSETGSLVMLSGSHPALTGPLRTLAMASSVSIGTVVDGEIEMLAGDSCLPVRHRIGRGPLTVVVPVPWGSWTHANPSSASPMTDWAASCLSWGKHRVALDLCAGIGTLTARLAPDVERLISIDEDFRGLEALDRALRGAGVDNVTVRPGRVGTILRKLRRELDSSARPTAAVINPMRRPLGDQLVALEPLGVTEIVYLGPSAVSAARDAALLGTLGYVLRKGAAINLHPGTGQTMLGLLMTKG
jgi:23S rRNA (uracil1939-C5)-methyltransferase